MPTMPRWRRVFAAAIGIAVLGLPLLASPPAKSTLPDPYQRLVPLHTTKAPPQEGDWLASHPEPGQTFAQYLKVNPVKVQGARQRLYVQPLGELTDAERRIVELTGEFMELYFAMEVKVLADLSLDVVPNEARRKHPSWGTDQILSTKVLELLKQRLPADAAALIALTAHDLWPGEGWNFVFGQASLRDRVGVWSIHRFGDPAADDATFLLCLRRALGVATHETGHMFSMRHCIQYECNMCGSNSLAESDRLPLEVCPECLAKLCHATGADPARRFSRLAEFCKQHGLQPEHDFYTASHAKLVRKD